MEFQQLKNDPQVSDPFDLEPLIANRVPATDLLVAMDTAARAQVKAGNLPIGNDEDGVEEAEESDEEAPPGFLRRRPPDDNVSGSPRVLDPNVGSLAKTLQSARFMLDDEDDDEVEGSGPVLAQVAGSILAIVLYRKSINPRLLEQALMAAWDPLRPVTMTIIEDNLFVFRFESRVDYNMVLRQGPWHYNYYMVAMREVLDDTPLRRDSLTSIIFWLQIGNIPPKQRKVSVANMFAEHVGQVLELDMPNGVSRYPYLRAKVAIDIRDSLPKETELEYKQVVDKVTFRYERLQSFYYWCGLI